MKLRTRCNIRLSLTEVLPAGSVVESAHPLICNDLIYAMLRTGFVFDRQPVFRVIMTKYGPCSVSCESVEEVHPPRATVRMVVPEGFAD